jgi:hypothetical protein
MALLRFGLIMAAVFFALVMAFGLLRFSIEVGESPVRYVVQDVGVFLAGVMGLWGCWVFSQRLQARIDALFREPPPFTGDRFEARVRRPMQALALALLVLISLASLYWFLREPGPKPAIVSVLMVGLTALLGSTSISMYRNGKPANLVLDTQGLSHPWYGHLPWAEVAGMNFEEIQVKGTWMFTMILAVSKPDRYFSRMPWVIRFLHNQWPATGQMFGQLMIPLNPMDKPPREIYAAAWALRHRVQPPLNSLWQAPPF